MPTVVRQFSFAANAEGLADGGNHAGIAFAFEGADGDPSNGSVKFTTVQNSLTQQLEYARRATTGETWADWGVPPGSTVTHAQITAWNQKVATDGGLDNFTLRARIIDGSTLPICSDLLASDAVPYTGAWEAKNAGPLQAIDSDSQSTSQDVRLELEIRVTTQIAGTNVDARFDTFVLTITYTEGLPQEASTVIPISNLSGLVFKKGFAHFSRIGGVSDAVAAPALQDVTLNYSDTKALAMGPESQYPLGVGIAGEVITGTVGWMALNAEQLQLFIGGTMTYNAGTNKTTWKKTTQQEKSPFNLRLRSPENGEDIEARVYNCLCDSVVLLDGGANREFNKFSMTFTVYGLSDALGGSVVEVDTPGNQTGSS